MIDDGFKMVLFTEPSKHLCRRYMRSTECPSSVLVVFTPPKCHKRIAQTAAAWYSQT